jgi:hypothetical protein
MNLDQLSSPLPKPWLDIACDVLTCRRLVVEPSGTSDAFSYYGVLATVVNAGSNVSGLAITPEVASPHYTVVGNIYTAPFAMAFQVSIGISVQTAVAQDMRYAVEIAKNGVFQPWLSSGQGVFSAPAASSNYFTASALMSLAPGDTVSWRFTNISPGQLAVGNVRFSGFPVA